MIWKTFDLFVLLIATSLINGPILVIAGAPADEYLVGVGIGDVTGDAAEIQMNGYADDGQIDKGIHTRLWSRAFIFGDKEGGGKGRVVFVSIETCMLDFAIKREVVNKLALKFGRELYTLQNVLISATHTHSGPGGYMQGFALTGGFIRTQFNIVVDGIVESIEKAHNSLQPGKVFTSNGQIIGGNINRSPSSYLTNPEGERKQYSEGDTDKTMVLLRIEGSNGKELGLLNWYAVHPTSMNKTNLLISGDNKGFASMVVEYAKSKGARPGEGSFVASFAQTNAGDVSPNTDGPKCRSDVDVGKYCDASKGQCGGDTRRCYASGPGTRGNMEESTKRIGMLQANKALELFANAGNHQFGVHGPVQSTHLFTQMKGYHVNVKSSNGSQFTVQACAPALGFSFAAGTTDGPGPYKAFYQGDTKGTDEWEISWLLDPSSGKQPLGPLIATYFQTISPAQKQCHKPKPILFNYGEMIRPYDSVPEIVEVQLLRIGNVYIAGFPGEITTMAGRRIRRAISDTVKATGSNDGEPIVVVAGLSNMYTHYVTTFEEYQKQRYEAASTLYGPYTLDAYLQQFKQITSAMMKKQNINAGPEPANNDAKQIPAMDTKIAEVAPFGKKFGDCLVQPLDEVKMGMLVNVSFIAGTPHNVAMRGGTFFKVERQLQNSEWALVATDADWNTKFWWTQKNEAPIGNAVTYGSVEFTWDTSNSPQALLEGVYRIRHFGFYRSLLLPPTSYSGSTKLFKLVK